jgi:BlaI family penicillinase repressor
MKESPRISDAEWEVIRTVWQKPGISAQEVIAELEPTKDWSPATIKTLLNRLLRKGALRFEKSGKAYCYHALVTEEECRRVESDSFLSRVFDGALSPMLAHFIRSRSLSKEELAELEAIVRKERTRRP